MVSSAPENLSPASQDMKFNIAQAIPPSLSLALTVSLFLSRPHSLELCRSIESFEEPAGKECSEPCIVLPPHPLSSSSSSSLHDTLTLLAHRCIYASSSDPLQIYVWKSRCRSVALSVHVSLD